MNTLNPNFLRPAWALLCGLAVAAPLQATESATKASNASTADTTTLQVRVDIPASWRPWLDDDVAEIFVSRIRDVFRRHGHDGEVKEILSYDEPAAGAPLLAINLFEWRVNRIGNIDCSFSATLQTGEANHRLGVFTNTSMAWIRGRDRFGLADSFDDAAEGAIRELFHKLARTELVPGLRES